MRISWADDILGIIHDCHIEVMNRSAIHEFENRLKSVPKSARIYRIQEIVLLEFMTFYMEITRLEGESVEEARRL